VVLTEGDKMILTPTYHVYDLFKNHQDATLLGHWLDSECTGDDTSTMPALSVSASEKDGVITLTAANFSADKANDVSCQVLGGVSAAKGRILTGAIDAKNTFDEPDAVKIVEFSDFTISGDNLSFTLPPCSVMEVRIEA
jgi:alpha-N-arabinofuranosidase